MKWERLFDLLVKIIKIITMSKVKTCFSTENLQFTDILYKVHRKVAEFESLGIIFY